MATRVRRKATGPNPPQVSHQPTRTQVTVPGDQWRARVKVMGIELFLGNFDTKAKADAAEAEYRAWRKSQQIKQGVAHA